MPIISTRRVIIGTKGPRFFGEISAEEHHEKARWYEAKAYRANTEKEAVEFALAAAWNYALADIIRNISDISEREHALEDWKVRQHPLNLGRTEAEKEFNLFYL